MSRAPDVSVTEVEELLRDGAVLANRHVTTYDSKTRAVTVDVAWTDERNLRGVIVPIGPGVQELKTFTIPT